MVSLSIDEEAQLQSLIDLSIVVAARGTTDPFTVRVLENGRVVHSRRVEPVRGGGPIRFVVPVAPAGSAGLVARKRDKQQQQRVRRHLRCEHP